MNRKILRYFNTHKLIEGLIVAIFGSVFIYLNWWGYSSLIVETLLGGIFFYLILQKDTLTWFWSGFFIGLFWFWWMGVSFYYYGHNFAIPLVIILVASVFGVEFALASRVSEWLGGYFGRFNREFQITFKALFLYLASYIHPFEFNWFKPELIFVNSFIGVDKWHFGVFLVGIVLLLSLKGRFKVISIAFLLGSISLSAYQIYYQEPEGRIELVTTWVDVRDKWSADKIPFQVRDTLLSIDKAIAKGKKAVILPESVLPFFLNSSKPMLKELKKRSQSIDIVLGALYYTKKENRNSLYFFHKGKFIVGDKVVLVPFGESNPLPDWASRWVNRVFFDGAPDYTPAKEPTDFEIDKRIFQGAICYEGTSDKIYKNRPKQLILISNNGWFYPSIEPTLQRLLLAYYVRVYQVMIYHSINYSKSYLIVPKRVK